MDPVTIVSLAGSVLTLLKQAKETFFDDKTINEAEEISKRAIGGNVENLKEQVNNQRIIIDKLVEQVKSNKDRIEQNIDIMVKLSDAVQQMASQFEESKKKTSFTLKLLSVVSIVSLLAALSSIFVVFSK